MEQVKCFIPETLEEALRIRRETGATILAGGSDLMVANSMGAGVTPAFKGDVLIITNLKELKGIRALPDGSVEIGVTDRRWTGAELDWTKLVDDPFLAVLPPDSDAPDPMPADYLSGKAVIIPDYGTNTDTTRVFTRAGVEPAYTDDRLNNRSVLAAVAAGLGSTVFSRLELDYYARQDLTVRAMDPPCCRELGVALRPGVKGDAVVRSFLRALRAAADADK